MFLSKLVAKAREAVGRFLHPLRTMMTEEELFTLDDLLVPDPEKPGRYTRASVIEAACYMMERGFVVKAGDNVGGDSLSATVDEQMVEDAKRLFTLRKKLPGATVENLIPVAVCEALNGIMSAHRAAARVAGKSTVRAKIPLTQIHERVKSRLDGLRGDETLQVPAAPSVAELREKWLPTALVGCDHAVLTDDTLELDVIVPPARRAHVR